MSKFDRRTPHSFYVLSDAHDKLDRDTALRINQDFLEMLLSDKKLTLKDRKRKIAFLGFVIKSLIEQRFDWIFFTI